MGLFDEQRVFNKNINVKGNIIAGSHHIRRAEKFLEVMQGNLDLGENLGMGYKDTIILDEHTKMNVSIQEGVTNPLTKIEIISDAPEGFQGPSGIADSKVNCPKLPNGRPGARMFSQVVGHGGLAGQRLFEEEALGTVPGSDTYDECNGNGFRHHGIFPGDLVWSYLGGRYKEFWYHQGQLWFSGPDTIGGETVLPSVTDSPCTLGFQPGEGDEFSPPQDNLDDVLWFGTAKGAGNCGGSGSATVTMIHGSFTLGQFAPTDKLTRGGEHNLQMPEESPEILDTEIAFNVVPFVCIRFESVEGSPFAEHEIVFVWLDTPTGPDSPAGCKLAMGMFFAGADGFIPGQFSEWKGWDINNLEESVGFDGPGCGPRDSWFAPIFCDHLGWDTLTGCIGTFPNGYGCYMTDANQKAAVFASQAHPGDTPDNASADDWRVPANDSAREWLSGRNFWIYLDGGGFPTPGAALSHPGGVGFTYQ